MYLLERYRGSNNTFVGVTMRNIILHNLMVKWNFLSIDQTNDKNYWKMFNQSTDNVNSLKLVTRPLSDNTRASSTVELCIQEKNYNDRTFV